MKPYSRMMTFSRIQYQHFQYNDVWCCNLLTGSHQHHRNTCKLCKVEAPHKLSPQQHKVQSQRLVSGNTRPKALRVRKMGCVKQAVSQMGRAVIGQGTWTPLVLEHTVTAAKRYARKLLLNYTEAKSTKLKQLLAGWIQGNSVHCTDFDKQPPEIRSAFLNASQNMGGKKKEN